MLKEIGEYAFKQDVVDSEEAVFVMEIKLNSF